MLLCGCPDDIDPTIINPKETSPILTSCPPIMSPYDNEHMFSLDQQQQTSQLDRFTYFLLAKCNTIKQSNSTTSKSSSTTSNDLLDILLNTLLREMSNPTHRDMARFITARFVRSVIRLFIILSLEAAPDKTSLTSNQPLPSSTTMKRISATTVTGATITTSSNLSSSATLNIPQSILFQCKRIFQSLTIISIEALVYVADSLLAPVRHGIAKPTAMFNLSSSHTDILQGLEEVFNIDSEYYRAYQENKTNSSQRTTDEIFGSGGEDLSETELDDIPNITNPLNPHQANIELNDDDDNNSDTQSQHETINAMNTSNMNERQTTRENAGGLSDNESEMELELLAESDTDNESNRSAPNTNTHRTSATAGSENMALFSDDENSESDDADSVRSDSVLGEGDETSQPDPMIFDDTRDALAAAAASSTTTAAAATANPSGITNDRLVLLPSGNTTTGSNLQTANPASSHLNVPRLNARTAMASKSFEIK
jgi:E3 ubiquitin-protein ligase EDD1